MCGFIPHKTTIPRCHECSLSVALRIECPPCHNCVVKTLDTDYYFLACRFVAEVKAIKLCVMCWYLVVTRLRGDVVDI